MKKIKFVFSCLLIAVFMMGCSVCTPKKATNYLKESLSGFNKVKVELIKSEECTYIFSVRMKEFKTPIHYKVQRENKKWISTPMK